MAKYGLERSYIPTIIHDIKLLDELLPSASVQEKFAIMITIQWDRLADPQFIYEFFNIPRTTFISCLERTENNIPLYEKLEHLLDIAVTLSDNRITAKQLQMYAWLKDYLEEDTSDLLTWAEIGTTMPAEFREGKAEKEIAARELQVLKAATRLAKCGLLEDMKADRNLARKTYLQSQIDLYIEELGDNQPSASALVSYLKDKQIFISQRTIERYLTERGIQPRLISARVSEIKTAILAYVQHVFSETGEYPTHQDVINALATVDRGDKDEIQREVEYIFRRYRDELPSLKGSRRHLTSVQEEEIITLHRNGLSAYAIENRLHVSDTAIRRVLYQSEQQS